MTIIRSFGFVLLIVSLILLSPADVLAKKNLGKHLGGQILVKFKNQTTAAYIDQKVKKHKGSVQGKVNRVEALIVKVPETGEEAALESFANDPNVEYVEPDYLADAADFPLDLPNDLNFISNQWGLDNTGQTIFGQIGKINADVNAEIAWQTTLGNGVKVAVLDSGIDSNHPDLSAKISLLKDFSGSGSSDDLYGHGTHVSGIVAASTNNGIGVAGTCPGCSLLVGKVLNNSGSGAYSWIANGIVWATDNGAKVINLSLAGTSSSITLENAINYAVNNNVVVVAAAGNSSNTIKNYPAGYANVISVASTNNLDQKSSFSNYGNWVSVAAPGENIYSTFPTHSFYIRNVNGKALNYDFLSGTSMATPTTAGIAALIWSTPFGTSAASVRTRLESTADKISGTGTYWKNGRVNAAAAVLSATPTPSPSATAMPSPTSSPVATPTPSPTPSPTPLPSPTPSISPSPTPTVTPTPSPLPSPSATPVPGNLVKVSGISYVTYGWLPGYRAIVVNVNIVNNLNNPVNGASVSVSLKNTTTGQSWTGTTSTTGAGTASFNLGVAPRGIYTTTVTGVMAAGLNWDSTTPTNSFTN